MGITYPSNMFPLVLKNWCKKIAEFDDALKEIYNQPVHEYLREKNKFGAFVLSEQLTYGTRIKNSVDNVFDIEISLEDIYSSQLSNLKSLFQNSDHVDDIFDNWIQQQSIMYRYFYDVPETFLQSLGYNSRATRPGNLSVHLDMFDNVLIQKHFHTTDIPNFDTLQEALDFFGHGS